MLNFAVVACLQTERRVDGHSVVICAHSAVGHLLVVSLNACVVSILVSTRAPVHLDRRSMVLPAQVICVVVPCLLNCQTFDHRTKINAWS